MLLKTLATVIESMHYANFLESPRGSKGGLMLVAQPESLKSEILKVLYGRTGVTFRDDIHAETIKHLLPQIATGGIQTLVLPEFQKLFERRESTWMNTLGFLRAFVHDGVLQGANDGSMIQETATCTVLGGVTPVCYKTHTQTWRHNGFGRRVLWCHYKLEQKHKETIKTALRLGVNLEMFEPRSFQIVRIPVLSKDKEKMQIDAIFKQNTDPSYVPYDLEVSHMLYKIFDVLKWEHSKEPIDMSPMDIMRDFIPSLGTFVELELPVSFQKQLERRKKERDVLDAMSEASTNGNGERLMKAIKEKLGAKMK